MLGEMTHDGGAFLQCPWKLHLRRERIVHAHHSYVTSVRVFSGQPVVGVHRGLNPPAAVEVNHHGQSFIYTRPIEPAQNAPTTRGNPTIDRLRHHWPTGGGFQSYGI